MDYIVHLFKMKYANAYMMDDKDAVQSRFNWPLISSHLFEMINHETPSNKFSV